MESFNAIIEKKPQLQEVEEEDESIPAGIFYDQTLGKQLLKNQHANQIKQKIKKLISKIDSKNQGIVNRRVFFEIVELHEVKLTTSDIKQLCNLYGCDREGKYSQTSQCVIGQSIDKDKVGVGQCEFIRYKDALSMIYIDLNAEGEKWMLRQGGNHYLTQAKLNQLSRMSNSKLSRFSQSTNKRKDSTEKHQSADQSIVVTSTSNLLKKFSTNRSSNKIDNDPYSNYDSNNKQSQKIFSRNKLRNASLSLGLSKLDLSNQAQCSDKYDQYKSKYISSLSTGQLKKVRIPKKNIETIINEKNDQENYGKRRYKERTYNYGSVNYDPLVLQQKDVSFISLESGGLGRGQTVDHRVQKMRSSATESFLSTLLVNQFTGQLKKDLTILSHKLQSLQVDPRIFNNMKTALFGLERTVISEQDFYEVFMSHFKQSIKSTFIYDLVLAQIKLEPIDDAPDPKPLVSITKLLALIDFFSFLPSKFTQVNNSSIEMVQLLQQPLLQPQDDSLLALLSMIELKMKERYSSTASCFRAFDRSQTGEINLPEFQHAIETLLKVKIATEDSEKVFRWLDSRGCGVIDYKEFSRINTGIVAPETSSGQIESKQPQQSSMPLLNISKTSFKQTVSKPVLKQPMNLDLEHLNQTESSSFVAQQPHQRRTQSSFGMHNNSNSLKRLGDFLRNKQPVVTVGNSQTLYGVSVLNRHQNMNPVTLNKFLQTAKNEEEEVDPSQEISGFSHKWSQSKQQGVNQKSPRGNGVRLMPMKNALIQEYYDNKKTMFKLCTATKYTTSKLY